MFNQTIPENRSQNVGYGVVKPSVIQWPKFFEERDLKTAFIRARDV